MLTLPPASSAPADQTSVASPDAGGSVGGKIREQVRRGLKRLCVHADHFRHRWDSSHQMSLQKLGISLSHSRAQRRRLTEVMKTMESRFTSIGDRVEKMTAASSRLVSEGQRLLVLTSSQSQGEAVLESAIGLLQSPLGYVEQCADSLEGFVQKLENCEEQIRCILGLQAQLEATIAPLSYIQVLYKVESAALPTELQQMFVAVSHDIANLEANVAGMFKEKCAVLGSMHKTIADVLHHLRTVLPVQRKLGEEKKSQIARTLADLQVELEKNGERDSHLSSTTRAVATEVGRMVVGLQYHDIVTQKTAHLTQLFQESEAKGAHIAQARGSELSEKLGVLHESNRLQLAHLAAIRHDLAEAMSTIAGGVRQAATCTGQLDEGCATLADLKKVTVAPDGMIQVLLDAIRETRDIVNSTLSDAGKSHGELNPIETMAKSITSTMTDLAVTMHLIALNAQIQAVRVGEGTGLEVLAINTVRVSAATTSFSQEALDKLNGLASLITDVIGDFSKLRETGLSHLQMLKDRGSEVEKELLALRSEGLEALSGVASQTQTIKELCGKILQDCEPDAEFEKRFEGTAACLEEAGGLFNSLADKIKAPLERSEESWRERYTMASERDVHAAVVGASVAVEAKSMVEHAAANTELFESIPPLPVDPAPNQTGSSAPVSADLGANVDLF